MQKRSVLIDCHEPPHIDVEIRKLGLEVERIRLESGDYCIGNILIERKEINDFWKTLNDNGRLFDQLHKMSTTGKKCILIVIGAYPKSFAAKKIPYKVAIGRLKNLVRVIFLSYGVLMEIVEDENAFVKYIGDCWKRANGESIAPVAKKEETPFAIKRAIISCIPSIGAKLSDFLATNYTISQLYNMTEEELTNITFNGKKLGVRGKKIKEVFGY